ncbi:DUF488 domain-containing protein [Gimesia panareensis]|uniref:Uncharacterized protein n=1 Tax=Gimesia panareensis TaxID=2527978 RepID=A0A517QB64_9PLAN|nr:DUF488 family protein [Gimesia panareensis]QDT28872.1 hypothetical protein Enr10x_42180 [Gimesia panareensis]QDU51719.1 hypothetical protein Pan110_40860 [Gimesia panareensis]
MSTQISIKRVYEDPESEDGFRVLVDRLWPRGMSKAKAKVDLWAKDLAPSTELRKWFHGHSDQYQEFTEKYRAELEACLPDLQDQISELAQPRLTLLTSVKEPARSHVPVLQQFLETQFSK